MSQLICQYPKPPVEDLFQICHDLYCFLLVNGATPSHQGVISLPLNWFGFVTYCGKKEVAEVKMCWFYPRFLDVSCASWFSLRS